MQKFTGSFRNLAALENASDSGADVEAVTNLQPIDEYSNKTPSRLSLEEEHTRMIIVANHLPLRATEDGHGGHDFEWDEDALIAQAKQVPRNRKSRLQEGIEDGIDVIYVGGLPVDVPSEAQDRVYEHLVTEHKCYPVFLDADTKQQFYKGFCKQQLWPLLHYVLPMSPYSVGRYSAELWEAYVRANRVFAERLVAITRQDQDYVWVHDYHLMVLPSLLRRRLHKVAIGFFLHSAFPSSEIFRTFPKRDELLRALLNADVLGFHTFDYARHFISCCSRMLGLEHHTARGRILLSYHGRSVHLKILPTCVKPQRYLEGFEWPDTQWRIGELAEQLRGRTVLAGIDDLDVFKGIEMKLLAYERLLDLHEDWRGRLVMVQMTNPPRGNSREDLAEFIAAVVSRVNKKYGDPRTGYTPLLYEQRAVPLHDRLALFALAHCAVVTPTRDGMNLAPYEYIVCRQGAPPPAERTSMLVVSEFVGCSPSLSGALRVNPWSIDSIADGMYTALKMPHAEQLLRHDKHWAYVAGHTVQHWAHNFTQYLVSATEGRARVHTYALGLGLGQFRVVALDAAFRKLPLDKVVAAARNAQRRLILCDYDGTLVPVDMSPTPEVKRLLQRLTAAFTFYLVSGRVKAEMDSWFADLPNIGIAAEHGYLHKAPGSTTLEVVHPGMDFAWKELVRPIMAMYAEATDGSYVQEKGCGLTWGYGAADPDFGRWQAKELLDHLESLMIGEAITVVAGHQYVEVKPRGLSKGAAVKRLLHERQPDFVLCLGDDKSDEEMFHAFAETEHAGMTVFACTVGQKPSEARFFVNDHSAVVSTLSRLADAMLTDADAEAAPAPQQPER